MSNLILSGAGQLVEEGWKAPSAQLCEVCDLPDQGKAGQHCNHGTSHVQVGRASAQVNSGEGVKCTGLLESKAGPCYSLPAPVQPGLCRWHGGEKLWGSPDTHWRLSEHLGDQVQYSTYSLSAVCHPLQNLGNVIIAFFPSVTKTGGIKCGFIYWLSFLDTPFSAAKVPHFAFYQYVQLHLLCAGETLKFEISPENPTDCEIKSAF